MITPQQSSLLISGAVTVDTVPQLFKTGKTYLSKQDWQMDLSQVTAVDSSAVSLLLGWLRYAKTQKRQLTFSGLPPDLLSLAQLYAVDEMLLNP